MKYFREILLVATLVAIAFSHKGAFDPFTWWLEAAPVFIGIIFLIIYREFKFTNLVYMVIFIHFVILLVGAHYTYANVPFFDSFGSRNNYDKVGHFMQGFSPALVAREVFIRKKIINGKKWLFFLVLCFVMFVSSFYELVEWWISLFYGKGGDNFLGTQGYIWDTQSDMLMALIGGVIAQILFLKQLELSILKTKKD